MITNQNPAKQIMQNNKNDHCTPNIILNPGNPYATTLDSMLPNTSDTDIASPLIFAGNNSFKIIFAKLEIPTGRKAKFKNIPVMGNHEITSRFVFGNSFKQKNIVSNSIAMIHPNSET